MIKRVLRRLKYITRSKVDLRHELVGPIELWELKRNFQIAFLKDHGLNNDDRFLDLGCGTLRGGIPIIEFLSPGKYYGIDIRMNVLYEAKKELRRNNLINKNPEIRHFQSFNQLQFSNKFDVILAFSVLIHMDDKIVAECFKFISENLDTSGVFFANVNIVNETDSTWQQFPVVFKDHKFYEELASTYDLLIENLGDLKSLGHHSGDRLQDMQVMMKFTKKKQ